MLCQVEVTKNKLVAGDQYVVRLNVHVCESAVVDVGNRITNGYPQVDESMRIYASAAFNFVDQAVPITLELHDPSTIYLTVTRRCGENSFSVCSEGERRVDVVAVAVALIALEEERDGHHHERHTRSTQVPAI
jgi:hypothetical protein